MKSILEQDAPASDVKKLSVAKNVAWNTVGNIFYLFTQWILLVIVVRVMGYEDGGLLSLAVSVTSVFLWISTFGMRSYQSTDIQEYYEKSTYIAARLVTCTVSYLLCCLVVFVTNYTHESRIIIIAFMASRTVEAIADVYQGILQKKWRLDIVGKSLFIRAMAQLLCFVILIYLIRDIFWAIVAMTISGLVVVLVYDIKKTKSIDPYRFFLHYSDVRRLIITCFPLAVYYTIVSAIITYPKYCLERIIGEEALGIYSSISMPTLIVQAVFSFVATSFLTMLAEYSNQNNKNAFVGLFFKIIGILFALSLISILAILFFGDWVLRLMFGSGISEYAYLLIPTFISTVFFCLAWFINSTLIVLRSLNSTIIGGLISGIICVLFSSPLIVEYGIDGVNTALLLSLSAQITFASACFYFSIKDRFHI